VHLEVLACFPWILPAAPFNAFMVVPAAGQNEVARQLVLLIRSTPKPYHLHLLLVLLVPLSNDPYTAAIHSLPNDP